jgi:putative salt-induced outer membrane protein
METQEMSRSGKPGKPFRHLIFLVLTPMLPMSAHGQGTDTLGWHFVGNLGYVQTSGNTSLSTVNLGEKLSYRPNLSWTFTNTAEWVFAKTSGSESANRIAASLRADYSISTRLTAFGLFNYERDLFAGIGHRTEELLGLSFIVLKQPKQALSVDVGAGNTQQLTGGVTSSYFVARVAPKYRYNITDKAYFEENLEFLENLQTTGDLKVTSTSALVAPLTSRIAIRLSYLMKYVAQPPLNTGVTPNVPFKKLDTTFTSGIQLTL